VGELFKMTYVIAFSGTPIKDGTIEKGLKMVLEGTGADTTELVRLSSLDLKVCKACKKCASTNRCIIKDDLNPLLDKIEKSDAYLLSGYSSFSSLNALTKLFIERNWPLRHNFNRTIGKIGGAVVAGSLFALDALETYFQNYYEGYLGMEYKGTVKLKGNVPCMTCGYGEECDYSGFLREYGKGAKVTPDKFYDPNNDKNAKNKALNLGKEIYSAITNKRKAS
jgi:multimeric flavodoxin WrbA